jgi:hypothetical protein
MQKVELFSINKALSLFILIILVCSCSGIKPGSKSKGGKYFEAFYIGEGKNQYFIKPLEFDSEGFVLKIDFTIRDFEYAEIGGVANFSVFTDELINQIDSVRIFNDNSEFNISDINRMFFEKYKSGYQIRSSMTLSAEVIDSFFSSSELKIEIFFKNSKSVFHSNKSLNQVRNVINSDLIQLLKYY